MKRNPILDKFIPLADMLHQTFGRDCEVVLHDLSDPEHSVYYVVNGTVTGRKIGESFEQLIRQVILSNELRDDYVANYYFYAANGKLIRSSSLLIRDDSGKLIGAICINIDTSYVTEQLTRLYSQLPNAQTTGMDTSVREPLSDHQETVDESFHVSQMITTLIDSILSGCDPQSLSREEKIEKIRFMESKGIFQMKGSIERVAEKMGVNKVTVYSYLDVIRGKRT